MADDYGDGDTPEERHWRLREREYTPLTKDELTAVLLDTGKDCPDGNYTPAQVYAMARDVVQLRETVKRLEGVIEERMGT